MTSNRDPVLPPAEPVRTASEQIASQLRQLILLGLLASGDRLPTESELCANFRVGRSTVREAVRILVTQRLLRVQRGSGGGTFVVDAQIETVSDQLEMGIGMLSVAKQVSIQDLLEARRILEVPAAGLAAEKRTDEDLQRISEALMEEERAPAAVAGGRRVVHAAILDAAHNNLMRVMVRPVFAVLQTRYFKERGESELWSDVNLDHAAIFEAIKVQDRRAAEDAMRRHLVTLESLYSEIEAHAH